MSGGKVKPEGAGWPAGAVLGMPAHESRAGATGEVHARPHPLIEAPRALVQLSFMTEAGSTVDRAVLAELSRRLGVAAPDSHARHHTMKWGKGALHWEQHTEFSTYLWDCPLDGRTGRLLGESPIIMISFRPSRSTPAD